MRRAAQAIEKRIEAQQIGHARLVHRLPHVAQLRARAFAGHLAQTRGERHGVDRAGARRADPADLELVVLEQTIEHAPGEGAVRAAALERQVDLDVATSERHAIHLIEIVIARSMTARAVVPNHLSCQEPNGENNNAHATVSTAHNSWAYGVRTLTCHSSKVHSRKMHSLRHGVRCLLKLSKS